jgi:hypothetical protein
MRSTYLPTSEDRANSLTAAGAPLGFSIPTQDEVEEARSLAVRLVGAVATTDAFVKVRSVQPAALLVSCAAGRVRGIVATLFLSRLGERKLAGGEFNGLDPDLSDLAGRMAPASSYYIWGVGGDTRLARWAAMEFCRRLRNDVLADLPCFTRAATADGRRAAISRLGFHPLRRVDDDLLVSPPIAERRAA